jgi:hypothetical protein
VRCSTRAQGHVPLLTTRIFLGFVGIVAAILPLSGCGSSSHPANTSLAGVLVCRDPIQGPEALGGWQCPSNSDIGRAPIEPPESLMCLSDLRGVKNATVGIQLFYRDRLVEARTFHSSDSSTELYVVLDRSLYPALATRSGLLRSGRYRCRFFAHGRLVHDRAFVVNRVAARPARLAMPRVVQRISFIRGALFDPSSADKIARQSLYAAWIRLADEHTADIAIWPSRAGGVQAVKRYETRGPQTRPINPGSYPLRLVRVDRIRNVTIAWYARPTPGDRAAFRSALFVSRGGTEYTRLWAIPGALMDSSTASASVQAASYEARIVPEGCGADGCSDRDLEVAIWPSESAAGNYFEEYKDVSDQGPFERIKNATISWNFHPSRSERAAVVSALH